MSVKIWCPQCHKKYALPARKNLAKKRVTCKQCENSFRVGDAMQPPSTQATDAPSDNQQNEMDAPPVAMPLVHRPKHLSCSQITSPVDMSQFFIGSATGELNWPQSGNLGQPPSSPRHDGNPWMIPAILAAILFSLFLASAAFFWKAHHIVNQARVATRAAQTTSPHQETKTQPVMAAPPNRVLTREDTAQGAQNIIDQQPNTPFDAAIDNHRSAVDRQLEKMNEEIARERKQFDQQRKKQLELDNQQRAAEKKARKNRQKKRDLEYAQQILQREQRKRILAEQKLHLSRLERDADAQPLENLITRIPTKNWGATCLAMGSKQFFFMGTTKGVQVCDYKRKKITFDTEKFGWEQRVECLALHPKERMLAVGCSDGSIQLFSVSNRGKLKSVGMLSNEPTMITHVAFDKDGSRLVSIGALGNTSFWDVNKEKLIKSVEYFGRSMVVASVELENSQIRLTDGQQWKVVSFDDGEIIEEGSYQFRLSREAIYLSDPNRVFNVSGSQLEIYQAPQAEPIVEMKGNGVQWTAAKAGKNRVLTGGNGRVYQWNTIDGNLTHVWSMPEASYIQKISVSADGTAMAATSSGPRQDVYVFEL